MQERIKKLNDGQASHQVKNYNNSKAEKKTVRVWSVPEFKEPIDIPGINVGGEEIPVLTSNRAPTAIVGPPGTGKTHSLIEIVRQHLRDGAPPESVGFFSFSRKAAEGRDRAIAELNLDPKRLLYFQNATLSSVSPAWLEAQ